MRRKKKKQIIRYADVADQIMFELLVDDVQIVILKPQRQRGPDANLLGFKPGDELIWRRVAPVGSSHQYDGFVNLYIRDGNVWVGSQSGFELRIDHRTGAIEEQHFTK
jgi:hypothetical protein